MANIKISIIVLNYNGIKDTIECLKSINNLKTDNISLETVVVDNNSTDNSQKKLSKMKNIHLIFNKSNMGFSAGNNIGIKYALQKKSDFILILNNDTIVEKSLLFGLLKSVDLNDIISPKILFAPGFEFHKKLYGKKDIGKIIWYAGGIIDWDNIIGKHIGVDIVDKGQYNNARETDYATGACMLIKSEVFNKIGLFDEKYFLYLEDMDFCVRAKFIGFKIGYEPSGVIWHKNAGSTGGSGSELQDYYFTKSRLLFSFKHAKIKTKLAVLKEIVLKSNENLKRKAIIGFMLLIFRRNNTKI